MSEEWDRISPERAKVLDRRCREEITNAGPENYQTLVRIWNRVIARIYGRVFDPSHDREKGMTPSG